METLLTRWMPDSGRISILDQASISVAREAVRVQGAAAGLPQVGVEHLVLAMSELANNQLRHAGGGDVSVRHISRDGISGLEIAAADRGGGLADPGRAFRGETRQSDDSRPPGGLGFGFSSVFRSAEEVDVDSRQGEGLHVQARSFARPVSRGRQLACLGRPLVGEPVSGDDVAIRRDGARLNAVVADGLGHGRLAREPAERLCQALCAGPPPPDPGYFLRACHARLQGTRGSVAAAFQLDENSGELLVCSVGNVVCALIRRDGVEVIPAEPGVIGRRGGLDPRFEVHRLSLGADDLLVLWTDGLSSRLDLAANRRLRLDPALLIADALMLTRGQTHDDATVLVLK